MKTKITFAFIRLAALLLLLSTINHQLSTVRAQGTAFTYQGRLNEISGPANGSYDFTFQVFDAPSFGAGQSAVVTNSGVSVTDGLLTVTLDFGVSPFSAGAPRWLEIGARTSGAGSFGLLTPRQALTATPYAITAGSAGNLLGNLPAAQLSGALASAQLAGAYSGAVTLSNAANSFTGNGTGLTSVNAASLNGLNASNFWRLDGNNVAAGQFLGSTNNQPVIIKVAGLTAWQISPTVNDFNHSNIVNLVGGSPVNFIAPGVYGSVIVGGGALYYFGVHNYTNSVASDFSFLGGGVNNSIHANASSSFLGGGFGNSIQPNAYNSFLGGGDHNSIQTNANGSFLGGGGVNSIQPGAAFSFLGGGLFNSIQPNADYSFLGGGSENIVSGSYGTVPGGDQNVAGTNSFAAGHRAKANHTGSFVWADSTEADFASTSSNQFLIRAGGGVGIGTTNPASALDVNGTVTATAFQGGGNGLTLDTMDNQPLEFKVNGIRALQISPTVNDVNHSNIVNLVGGSPVNFIAPGVYGSVIVGGGAGKYFGFPDSNSVSSDFSFLGGGGDNSIQPNADYSFLGGGSDNTIQAFTSFLGGGDVNSIQANASESFLGGGANNSIEPYAEGSFLGGGWHNSIQTNAYLSFLGGGFENSIQPNAYKSFLGGGDNNSIQQRASLSFLGGGFENSIQTNAYESFLGGGLVNSIQTNAYESFLGGGTGNSIQPNASDSFLGGGDNNSIEPYAHHSFLGGGSGNIVSGIYGTVPGGDQNVAGNNSLAAGHRAKANHTGSFVWADSTDTDFATTGKNQFLIRAGGGVGIGKTNPATALDVNGTITATAFQGDGSGLTGVALLNTAQNFTAPKSFGPGAQLFVSLGSDVAPGIAFVGDPDTGIFRPSLNEVAIATAGTERLRVTSSGAVGIGRTPAANLLEVEGTASKTTAGSWVANSDARIKTDVHTITHALETLAQVRPVEFRYTDEYRAQHPAIEDRPYLNVTAQEFQRVFPDWVKSSGDKLPNGEAILQVDTYPLTIYSAAAIQELNRKVEEKEARIQELESRLDKLEQLMNLKNGGAE